MTGIPESVQDAVFNALNDSAELDGLLAPHNQFSRSAIYDRMPQAADSGNNNLFPMLTIGEDRVNDWSTDTATGGDVAVMVHIWSRSPGWREAKRIAAAVKSALHRQQLVTPDQEFIGCDFESEEMIRDPDGITLHIAAQYRMIVDEEGYGE